MFILESIDYDGEMQPYNTVNRYNDYKLYWVDEKKGVKDLIGYINADEEFDECPLNAKGIVTALNQKIQEKPNAMEIQYDPSEYRD